jgi:RNA polymerase sigma-70 factor (ECF subfamily)
MDADDAALLAAVREGSERAFNTLVDRQQQALRLFLRRLVADPHDAEDIAQETFVAAWMQAKSFAGRSSVRTWLFSIAWRKAKGAQRGWFRSRRRDTAYHEATLDEPSDTTPENRLALGQALEALPIDQRAAVVLCLGCGLTHPEAAEALGLPLGTVKSHVLRGRERLRDVLKDEP